MMEAIGHRKTAKPTMKFSNDSAEYTIFQGTMIQPPVMVMSMTPLRMLMYLWEMSTRTRDGRKDFNLLWEQVGQIVRCADDIGTKICADLSDAPRKSDKESKALSSRCVPLSSETNGIPNVFSIDNFSRRCGDDAKKSQYKTDEWQEEALPVDTLRISEISCEVGDIGSHRCPTTRNTHQAGHDQPRSPRSLDLVLLFPDISCSSSQLCHVDHCGYGNHDHDYRLEPEESF